MTNHNLIKKVIELRSIEETLLEQFKLGRVGGTVHTSIGQEITPVIVNQYITDEDWVFSNHRGHSHFLAQYSLVREVIAEIMGKKTGLCSGYGGSQHLQHNKFFSNGIQGGMTPIACGAAYSEKLAKNKNLSIVYIGDGTLGQGVFYEALNIAGWMKLPILFILEDNGIAQSTYTEGFNYSNLKSCVEGFNINFYESTTDDWVNLDTNVSKAIKNSRSNQPSLIKIKTRRLMSHSKGDDNRDDDIVNSNVDNDPLNKILKESKEFQQYKTDYKKTLIKLCDEISEDEVFDEVDINNNFIREMDSITEIKNYDDITVREKINNALKNVMHQNKNAIVIGEDIRNRSIGAKKEYGGAFKVTGSLSDFFDDRVINFPIAEQSIVGFGIGYALSGNPAICEIMFGDFSTLIVDQIYQHASKFTKMYGKKIKIPLIVRTPMGGRRGYGPTHSQSFEKLFVGCDGLQLISLNSFVDINDLYIKLIEDAVPAIIFENKIGYNSQLTLTSNLKIYETNERFKTKLISNSLTPDITFLAHGENITLALEALEHTSNLNFDLISPLSLSDLNLDIVLKSVLKSKKLIIIDEGSISGSIGSLYASELLKFSVRIDFYDYISNETIIPASPSAEDKLLPSVNKIINTIKAGMTYDS